MHRSFECHVYLTFIFLSQIPKEFLTFYDKCTFIPVVCANPQLKIVSVLEKDNHMITNP